MRCDMNGEKRPTLRDVVASVISEGSDNESVTVTESYTALKYGNHGPTPSKILKLNRYQLHPKTYSPKWEQDPTYKGWVQRSKKGDGYYYCLACDQDYTCGKSELDKHASSKKHCMNLMNLPRKLGDVKSTDNSSDDISKSDSYETESVFLTSQEFDASSTSAYDVPVVESKEEAFGKYIISELKRIKKKKTYEIVKWEILQSLQKAMLQEAETEDSED